MSRIGCLERRARQLLDCLLILPLHEVDQAYPLIPAPPQPRLWGYPIGFKEFDKRLVELTQHQLVVSDFLVENRITWESLSEFATCLDGGLELPHRTKDMTLCAAHGHALRCDVEGILQS